MSSSLSEWLWQRQCNKCSTSRSYHHNKFRRQVYGDIFFLNRMVLDKCLISPSDASLVSLRWSPQGDSLLSGSRMGQLDIWQPFNATQPLSSSIPTDGYSSLLCVNFLSKDRAISGSDTGTLWLFDLTSAKLLDKFACSKAHTRLDINSINNNDIVSCSEDGMIRHYDLRQRQQQHSYGKNENLSSCSSILLDYSTCSLFDADPIRLQDVSINPFAPHYLAVAGSQSYVYLHDRRMMGQRSVANVQNSLVKLFVNKHLSKQNELCYANTCQFSSAHDDILLTNWTNDSILLFNIHDNEEPSVESPLHVNAVQQARRYTGHLNAWVTNESIGFYGLDDDYILSGTDDNGMIFVWDRTNEKVVQLFEMGQTSVNAVQGHPNLPMIACAGSDHRIQLYMPTSKPLATSAATQPFAQTSYVDSSHMFEANALIERNERLKHGSPSHLFNYLIQSDEHPPPCYLQ